MKKIKGQLKGTVDYTIQPVVWDDVIDSADNYHFTVYTKQHFFDCINDCFKEGDKIVVLLNDKDKLPEVIVNQDSLSDKSIKSICTEYKKWLKEQKGG